MKLRRKPGKPGYWTKRSKKLGRLKRVFNEDEVFIFLKAAIERAGSSIAFAERYGINRTYVSHVLSPRSPIGRPIIKALGLHKVYIAARKNDGDAAPLPAALVCRSNTRAKTGRKSHRLDSCYPNLY
jgi:hypothetical protein